MGVIWDVFLGANWDVNWDANWDDNCDANWDANWGVNWGANYLPKQSQLLKRDVNWDANQCPKQHQILKRDANHAIKSAIPWKSIHFFQKMMKNTLKVTVDAKKEAKRDANHRFFLQ